MYWIADLRFTTAESSLQKEFANFGEIAEGSVSFLSALCTTSNKSFMYYDWTVNALYMAVKLVKDKMTNKSKGYAFIQYMSQEDALLALENMDHKVSYQDLACLFLGIYIFCHFYHSYFLCC